MQSERFADDSSEMIALNASACGTNRNSETETRSTFVVQERSHAKESIAKPPPVRIDGIKVRLATQATLRGERKLTSGRAVALQALLSSFG